MEKEGGVIGEKQRPGWNVTPRILEFSLVFEDPGD